MKKLLVSALFFLSIASGLKAGKDHTTLTVSQNSPALKVCYQLRQSQSNGTTSMFFKCNGENKTISGLTQKDCIKDSDVYIYYSEGDLRSDKTGTKQNGQ